MQNAIASSNHLNFPGIPAEFRENLSEKKSNLVEFQRIFEIFMKISNILRDCANETAKFESGEVQKNANLVDLEKC